LDASKSKRDCTDGGDLRSTVHLQGAAERINKSIKCKKYKKRDFTDGGGEGNLRSTVHLQGAAERVAAG
jgi:hypothetical protein